MEPRELEEVHGILARTWGVSTTPSSPAAYDELRDRLIARVAFMLRHDYERLLSSLYLLDVCERDLRAALETSGDAEQAKALAQLILDRETEKVESRKKYLRERSVDASFEVENDST
ncbi:MAG: hypothetical protein IID08_03750 [Candidatus Hydrogenedentes bacterium]|nr:hypothetical protein [Candidatus Hydrogenedentota bacterium]